jgi:hypothetical protein
MPITAIVIGIKITEPTGKVRVANLASFIRFNLFVEHMIRTHVLGILH